MVPRTLLAILLACAPLAGCLGGDDPSGPPANDTTNGSTNDTGNTTGGDGEFTIEFTNVPQNTPAGQLGSWTWRIGGPDGSEITRTEVRWSSETHADVDAAGVPDAYESFSPAFGEPYEVGEDQNRMVIAPSPGTWYVRAYAVTPNGPIATQEVQWTVVEPDSTTVTVPAPKPADGGQIAVDYRVNGPSGTASETGVVWGSSSVADDAASFDAYAGKEVAGSDASVPGTFSATIDASGTTHYRAYAIVDGTTYWSAEHVA